jgi:hypothetical protein
MLTRVKHSSLSLQIVNYPLQNIDNTQDADSTARVRQICWLDSTRT